jgi:hypothetical protein
MATPIQVVMDCADPARLATFWAAALHYHVEDPPAGFATWPAFLQAQGMPPEQWNRASAVVDPAGRGPRLYFQRVPEPKIVKNRVHLDLNASGPSGTPLEERRRTITAEVARLRDLGASTLRAVEEHGEYWVVMQDPEGNEFCVQ